MRIKTRRIGLNLKKYTIRQLKYLSKTEEYKGYKKEIRGSIPKRKIDRQWWDIRSMFGYRISKKRSDEYYKNLRKANRKLSRISQDTDLLKNIRLGYGVTWMKSVKDFERAERRVSRILDRNYKKQANLEVRKRFYENLLDTFGSNEYTQEIIEKFEVMTDTEFKEFFEKYPDLELFKWGSPKELIEYVELTQLNYNTLETYLEEFAKERGIDIGRI